MLHLLRWPSPSATSDDGRPCDSSLSDDKCETTFPSPATSSVASSATHLPEAAIKSQAVAYFVDGESVKGLDGLPCSRPLTTVRVLVAHIGYVTHFPHGRLDSFSLSHSAALTLFLATTDAVCVRILPCFSFSLRNRQLCLHACQPSSGTSMVHILNIRGSGYRICLLKRHVNLCMAGYLISPEGR